MPTSKMSMRYQGRTVAKNYDNIRKGRRRWRDENIAVENAMKGARGSVLDVACGTGRFFPLYKIMKLKVTGVDCSQAMLNEAQAKMRTADVQVQDATVLPFGDRSFDYVVCVRLLNLVDEPSLKKILGHLCRIARKQIVFTIALGEQYVLKKTTAVHTRKTLERELKKLGWSIQTEVPVLKWSVITIGRS